MLSKVSSLIVIILLVVLIVLNCWCNKKNQELTNLKFSNLKEELQKEKSNGLKEKINDFFNNRQIIKNYDHRILSDPFKDPKNRMENDVISDLNVYDNFNISTHGKLNDFHVIGVLNLSNQIPENKEIGPFDQKEIVNNATIYNNVLQLYGRQKYAGSREYEYYTTITSGNQTLKIPIFNKHKQELYDGDKVFIKELNKYYVVSKYPNEEIEYIPL